MTVKEKQRNQRYLELTQRASPAGKTPGSLLRAFVVGGAICVVGQLISAVGEQWIGLDDVAGPIFTSIVLIFLGATLTGLGLYDKLGSFAGAGSIVPITGFANSIVAPAMEFKREGYVTGVGAKLFVLAGPVLTYGYTSSVLAGLLYWAVNAVRGG